MGGASPSSMQTTSHAMTIALAALLVLALLGIGALIVALRRLQWRLKKANGKVTTGAVAILSMHPANSV